MTEKPILQQRTLFQKFRKYEVYSYNTYSKKQPKHEQYLRHARKKKLFNEAKPLSEVEIQILNDKIEISSSDEDDPIQPDKHMIGLPFLQTIKHRQTNSIIHKRKRITLIDQIQNMKHRLNNYFQQKQQINVTVVRQKSYLFSPDGYFKVSWDMLCMLLIFYEILSIPFKISFEVEFSSIWDRLVNAIFLFDIVMTFNTAIYLQGQIVNSRQKIAIEYFKMWFWLDIMASFPYSDVASIFAQTDVDEADETYDPQQNNQQLQKSAQLLRLLKFFRFVKVIRLLRLAKLKIIFDKIEQFLQLSTTIAAIASFIQLSGFVLFWSHWIGCIFHFVAMQEDPEENWLTTFGIYDAPWHVKYVNSIYWAVTTMITVGYGDISPQTPLERLCGIFFLQVACGVFSFTMSTIGNTLTQIDQKKQEYRQKGNETDAEYQQLHEQSEIAKITTKSSETLFGVHLGFRSSCQPSINHNESVIIVKMRIHNLSQRQYPGKLWKFLTDLTQIFKEQTILPDEFIFQELETEFSEKNLYFIQEGIVNIILIKTKQVVAKLNKSDYFGEISFFSNNPRTASAQSVYFSDLFYISQLDFLLLLKKHSNDLVTSQYFLKNNKQKFAMIRDSMVFKKDIAQMCISCFACLKDDHTVASCPNIHFIVDRYLFFRISQKCQRAVMSQFVRKDRINFQALVHQEVYIAAAASIQQATAHQIIFESDNCDIDDEQLYEDVDEIQIKFSKISQTGRLKTKFKDDKHLERKLKNIIARQSKVMGRLSIQQSLQMELFTEITQFITGNQTSLQKIIQMSSTQGFISQKSVKSQKTSSQSERKIKVDSSDSEEENQNLNEKFKQILQNYYDQQNAQNSKLNQDNWNAERNRSFMIMDDFDRGQDFETYFPYNNPTRVFSELTNFIQYGELAKPKIETEYAQEVFEYMIDYYQLDQLSVQQFKEQLRKDQLKFNLDYSKKMQFEQSRQIKILKNIIRSPIVKKIQKINNVIKAVKQLQINPKRQT